MKAVPFAKEHEKGSSLKFLMIRDHLTLDHSFPFQKRAPRGLLPLLGFVIYSHNTMIFSHQLFPHPSTSHIRVYT